MGKLDEIESISRDIDHVSEQPLIESGAIRFLDVWTVLYHRRYIIIALSVLGFATSVGRVMLMPKFYYFSTTIEQGQKVLGVRGEKTAVPVETADVTLAKITDVYIPAVLRKFAQEHSNVPVPTLLVTNPKSTRLFILKTKGAAVNESGYLNILKAITERVIEGHKAMLSPFRTRLKTSLKRAEQELKSIRDERIVSFKKKSFEKSVLEARNQLEDYKAERKLLDSGYERVVAESELVGRQQRIIESAYQNALKKRVDVSARMDSETTTVPLLMLDGDIQRYQEKLGELEVRLRLQIPEKLRLVKNRINENRRAQESQAKRLTQREGEFAMYLIDLERQEAGQILNVEDLRSHLSELQPTRIVSPAGRSLNPVGVSPLVQITVGVVFGLMLGLFVAIIVEFVANIRRA